MNAREQGVPRPKVRASRLRHNIIIYSPLLQVSLENNNFTHINRNLPNNHLWPDRPHWQKNAEFFVKVYVILMFLMPFYGTLWQKKRLFFRQSLRAGWPWLQILICISRPSRIPRWAHTFRCRRWWFRLFLVCLLVKGGGRDSIIIIIFARRRCPIGSGMT